MGRITAQMSSEVCFEFFASITEMANEVRTRFESRGSFCHFFDLYKKFFKALVSFLSLSDKEKNTFSHRDKYVSFVIIL